MWKYYLKEQDLLLISTLQKENRQMWLMNGHCPHPDTNHHCSTTQQLHQFGLVKWKQMNIYCKKTSIYHSAYAKYCVIKVQTDDKYISNYIHGKNKQIKP